MSSQVDIRTFLVSKMDIDPITNCWIWNGAIINKYGCFWRKRKHFLSHRISYSFFNNQVIPRGMLICHVCDNPPCINPSHLFLGTAKDNYDDMIKKGRSNHARGELSGRSKLKEIQILEIKRLLNSGMSHRIIADKFNVHYSTISLIANGKRWKFLQ